MRQYIDITDDQLSTRPAGRAGQPAISKSERAIGTGDCGGPCLVILGLTVNYDPSGPTLNQSSCNQSDDHDDDDGGGRPASKPGSAPHRPSRQFIRPSRPPLHCESSLSPAPSACAERTTNASLDTVRCRSARTGNTDQDDQVPRSATSLSR